jgi:hypothetical protein
MAESTLKNTKQPGTNEGPSTPLSSSQAEERKAPMASSKLACRTSGIHEQANILLYAARVDLKSALEVRTRLPKQTIEVA